MLAFGFAVEAFLAVVAFLALVVAVFGLAVFVLVAFGLASFSSLTAFSFCELISRPTEGDEVEH